MGRQSRMRALRKGLRPLMEAAVTGKRKELRNNPKNWKILPDPTEAVSHQNPTPQPPSRTPLLIAPTAAETLAVARSRR
jgi:hypothetical protein